MAYWFKATTLHQDVVNHSLLGGVKACSFSGAFLISHSIPMAVLIHPSHASQLLSSNALTSQHISYTFGQLTSSQTGHANTSLKAHIGAMMPLFPAFVPVLLTKLCSMVGTSSGLIRQSGRQ